MFTKPKSGSVPEIKAMAKNTNAHYHNLLSWFPLFFSFIFTFSVLFSLASYNSVNSLLLYLTCSSLHGSQQSIGLAMGVIKMALETDPHPSLHDQEQSISCFCAPIFSPAKRKHPCCFKKLLWGLEIIKIRKPGVLSGSKGVRRVFLKREKCSFLHNFRKPHWSWQKAFLKICVFCPRDTPQSRHLC